jgi:hydrogenase large subunit
VQIFTDYLVRLLKYVEFMRRSCRCTTTCSTSSTRRLPGYEAVGRRRVLLGLWGSFQNPATCDFRYDHMAKWGRDMFVTPGIVVDGELVTTDLVAINLGMRILLGSSFYATGPTAEIFVAKDPLGNPIDRATRGTRPPAAGRRSATSRGKYTWVMSPRWFDAHRRAPGARHRRRPLARLWTTALAGRSTSATSRRPARR